MEFLSFERARPSSRASRFFTRPQSDGGLKTPARVLHHMALDLEHGQGGKDASGGDLSQIHQLLRGALSILQSQDQIDLVIGQAAPGNICLVRYFIIDFFPRLLLPGG